MLKGIVAVATLAALAALSGTGRAADLALSVDTPLSFAFDKGIVAQPATSTSSTAYWNHRTSTDVSGYKVLLIAPFHLGVGYEDYTVRQGINFTCGMPTNCAGNLKMDFQFVDVVLDLPTRFVNIGLGYGAGQATGTASSQFNTSSTGHAGATQTFVTLGIPLGTSFDVHVGYHWVSVEQKEFNAGGGAQKLEASGEMLWAGLRLNF
jgi:hypothetical protein